MISNVVRRGATPSVELTDDAVIAMATSADTYNTLCTLREVCQQWRSALDSVAPTSELWRRVACALVSSESGVAPAVAPGASAAASRPWRELCRKLARHPGHMQWNEGEQTLGTLSVLPATVSRLLDWFTTAAEVSIVDCQVPFGELFDGNSRAAASLAVYTACSQKPPHNMQGHVYAWWMRSAFEIAHLVRERMAQSPVEAQDAARASFQSFVKMMTSVVLPYLDRFYVKRHEVSDDPGASLPSVRELGRRAIELIHQPFDQPPPARFDHPCPEVPLLEDGSVDEPTLVRRQRDAWYRHDMQRFDEILTAQAGGGGAVGPPPVIAVWAGEN